MGQVLAEISDPLPSKSLTLAPLGRRKENRLLCAGRFFIPCLRDCLEESTNWAGTIIPILQIA